MDDLSLLCKKRKIEKIWYMFYCAY
jgi:hypothetical protein